MPAGYPLRLSWIPCSQQQADLISTSEAIMFIDCDRSTTKTMTIGVIDLHKTTST